MYVWIMALNSFLSTTDITVGFDDPNSSMVGEGMPTQICTSITQGTLQRSITLIVTTSGTAAGVLCMYVCMYVCMYSKASLECLNIFVCVLF